MLIVYKLKRQNILKIIKNDNINILLKFHVSTVFRF